MILRKAIGTSIGILGLFGALAVTTTQAEAHAQLVSSNPAPDATVAAPQLIMLQFNEPLEARISHFELKNAHGDILSVSASEAPDDKSIVGTPESSLSPGLYNVDWSVAGDDGHPMSGHFSFTVE